MNDLVNELTQSLKTSFIDFNEESLDEYRTKLLVNNYKKGAKVFNYIEKELGKCDEFYFSIAFITNSGLNILLNTLKDLEGRGIKGKILTTNYLNFNDPKALKRLLSFSNLEVKIFDNGNFHSKGYIFKHRHDYTLIIGSSNLTQEALTKNEEWNIKVSSLENGELLKDTLEEFNDAWDRASDLTIPWIEEYAKVYNQTKIFTLNRIKKVFEKKKLKPNPMQEKALKNIQELRDKNEGKGLLISATGTGKTYLSVFDVQKFNPKKMLFVVHREQIAKKAMESFKHVFGELKSMGILSGTSKKIDCEFVFSTMQTLSKDSGLELFNRDEFDYIVIDEVHRAGAPSYLKILEYFTPKFLLGMTATPERTDGFNIYQLFDYNIAYEIRLQEALEQDMLCPFHYFGVSEITVNGQLLDDNSDFRFLTSEERVKNIIDKAEFYGHSGERVKGLIFCSRNDEAETLSKIFNNVGYQTLSLSGASSQEEREQAIKRLEQDVTDNKLDYIFTVDIFNEGIDIPHINQIIMLRPTESSIIFIQQLGRGLRKTNNKDYVVIIDFIGNYQKNFLIPIALSGDRTFNKDTIKRFVAEGSSVIPGCSTIQFDKISQKRIYDSINNSNFSTIKFLKDEYNALKVKIGSIPKLSDFFNFAAIDPQLIINYSKSYYNFLIKVDKDYNIVLNQRQIKFLEFLSLELSNGKRIHEIIIIEELINKGYTTREEISCILGDFDIFNDISGLDSALSILNNGFLNPSNLQKYNYVKFIKFENDIIKISDDFKKTLDNNFLYILNDLIIYSKLEYEKSYKNRYNNLNISLYEKYSRRDACRLLNWVKDESSVIYGYKIKHNTCPIFVTYHKDQDIIESIKYEDQFLNRNIFSWMTKNNRTLNSKEVLDIINHKENNLKLLLFVKKDDADGTDFYFLGEMEVMHFAETTIKNKDNKNLPIVNIKFKLDTSVREDIYNYLTK
ncbi:MAG: DEAD/DEAH box helicase [Candidatus Cloacimonetes bacterium]|nr:DEAD/DEAH box helicase [Candidatus Cloacimonadota bacterium]